MNTRLNPGSEGAQMRQRERQSVRTTTTHYKAKWFQTLLPTLNWALWENKLESHIGWIHVEEKQTHTNSRTATMWWNTWTHSVNSLCKWLAWGMRAFLLLGVISSHNGICYINICIYVYFMCIIMSYEQRLGITTSLQCWAAIASSHRGTPRAPGKAFEPLSDVKFNIIKAKSDRSSNAIKII